MAVTEMMHFLSAKACVYLVLMEPHLPRIWHRTQGFRVLALSSSQPGVQ